MNLPSIDTTTYSRFLLTIGIGLLALSVFAPWLLMQASSDPLLSSEERTALSAASLRSLERREALIDKAFDIVWPTSALLAAAGIGAMIAGALRARRKEDLEFRVLESRVRKPSDDEKNSKLRSEAAESVRALLEEHVAAPQSDELVEVSSVIELESAIRSDYGNVELLVLGKLQEAFPSGRVEFGVAIDSTNGTHLADALVQRSGEHFVIEVKYQTVPTTTLGEENARRLLAAVEAYESGTQATAKGILMYVLPPRLETSPSREEFEARLAERSFRGWSPSTARKIRIVVIGRNELEAIGGSELADRIG